MAAILSALSWLFRFSLWEKVVDFFLKRVTFGAMLSVNLALMGFFVSYIYSIYKIFQLLYSLINKFIDFINNYVDVGDSIARHVIIVLKSIGAWNAFLDVYSIFSPILSLILSIYLGKLGVTAFKGIRENLISLCISKI